MKHKGWVKSEDVRPGDILLEHRGYANGKVSLPSPAIVKLLVQARRDGDDRFTHDTGELYYGGYRKLEWLVEREGLDFGPTAATALATPTKKVINEFPDFCTRCGRPAYVGAWEITHKNEPAAKDCPARRK